MGGRMRIRDTRLAGVQVVETDAHGDARGAFARLFCARELAPLLGDAGIVQVNQSRTALPGSVRGLHFQRAPQAEIKFVRCLKGRVWDVAVDLRAGSPTFLQWHAEELSEANARMLVVPQGCAHGFQVLEPDSELLYLHTAYYDAAAEGGVSCTDPRLAIAWPLPIVGLSPRDASHPPITPDFPGLSK
jgi:dTDP-4-dehydrorhamnose 3,5-epimerase